METRAASTGNGRLVDWVPPRSEHPPTVRASEGEASGHKGGERMVRIASTYRTPEQQRAIPRAHSFHCPTCWGTGVVWVLGEPVRCRACGPDAEPVETTWSDHT